MAGRDELLLKKAQKLSHTGSFWRDLKSVRIEWSDQLYIIFGYKPGEVVPTFELVTSHVHPEDRSRFLQIVEDAVAARSEYENEFRINRKDGEVRVVRATAYVEADEKGEPSEIWGALQDITSLRKAEEALQASELLFSTLTVLSPAGIYMTDAAGRCTYVNPRWCEMFGMTRDEALGDGWVKGLHPEDRERVAAEWYANAAQGGSWCQEYRFLTSGGKVTWVYGTARQIQDATGVVTGYIGVNTDITDRKRAEDELKKISWLLSPPSAAQPSEQGQSYGDLSELNRGGEVLQTLGQEMLHELSRDFLGLLGTSAAVYEANGDYAFGLFASGWCRFLDHASRSLCEDRDNAVALVGGKWLCHESCWTGCAKTAIETGQIVDIACQGGLRLYCAPIRAGDEIVGAINFGYGSPPQDPVVLAQIAGRYNVPVERLRQLAADYETRPDFIIEVAKNRLQTVAKLLGEIIRRCRLEKALRAERDRAQQYLDIAEVILLVLDNDGRIQLINQRGCKLLEYSEDELRGAFWFDRCVPERERPAVREIFAKLMRDEHELTEHAVGLVVTRSGQEREIQWHNTVLRGAGGEINGTLSSGHDITEQQRQQRALIEREAHIRYLYESVPAGILVQAPDGRIVHANRVAQEIFGMPEDIIIGKTSFDSAWQMINEDGTSIEGQDHPSMVTMRTGKPVRAAVRGLFAGDARTVRWLLINTEPVWSENKDALAQVIITFQDITELKRAELERARLEDQLRQSQKMEAVGQLAGGIAHDFNNLLHAADGYLEIALNDLEGNAARVPDYLREVQKAIERAAALTRQLLAFSRRETLQPKIVSVNEIISEMLNMLQRVIGENIALQLNTASNLDSVYADSGQIEQILVNLCVNARDAMVDGGEVTIATQNIALTPDYCAQHLDLSPGRYVCISIRDSGAGIAEDLRHRIFEPFFTTKEVGKGTGLGLAIVYAIVKRLSGHIEFDSAPSQGTEFRVYIPVTEMLQEAPEAGTENAQWYGGNETILLAEDNEAVRGLAEKVLQCAGYRVLAACDGEQAIELIERHGADISGAVLDVVMPKKSGFAVCEKLHQLNPDCAVLFCSGYSYAASEGGRLPQGTELIQKPYRRQDLLSRLRRLLDGARRR